MIGFAFIVSSLAAALPPAAPAEIRLSPAEIVALARRAGGAGTSNARGITTTVLQGDPSASGRYTISLYVPPHTRIAAHTHADARTAVVVSGEWYLGYGAVNRQSALKRLGPGSFYTEPAGVPHFARTGRTPVIVYISGQGPSDTHFTEKQ
jgi:uncharacterized RmlC-like cupin family protein